MDIVTQISIIIIFHCVRMTGTSVGGMLSLMLAAGHTPKECQELLRWGAPHIFGYFPWRVINPFKSKYSHDAKEQIMQEYFGDRTMMDLLKKCAVIAFRLDGRRSRTHSFFNKEGWRPAVFSNMPKASGVVEPDHDLLVNNSYSCPFIFLSLYIYIYLIFDLNVKSYI